MPGSSSFDPAGPDDLSVPASAFVVARFDRQGEGDDRFTVLPNVKVESIHYREGATVPTAQFSYILDDTDPDSPTPATIADLWPLAAAGPYVVRADDELIVWEFGADGDRTLVFDGFASIPQVDQSGEGLRVTFVAEGVGVRLRDTPIGGAIYRDADKAQDTTETYLVPTDLPTWFNPTVRGKAAPNKTPDDHDVHQGEDGSYPVFLDRALVGATPPQDFWTLGDLVRYLSRACNDDETWVDNPVGPDGEDVGTFLQAVAPVAGETFDLADPATFTRSPIVVRSFDATGMTFVEALAEQLHYYRFEIAFNLREEEDGTPINELILYRKDGLDGAAPVELYYPEPGGNLLDDGIPDFDAIAFARDQHDSFNEVEVETDGIGFEASFVLAAGFHIAAADASNPKQFDHAKLASATDDLRAKYRVYVFDEAGDGHWDVPSAAWMSGTDAIPSLDKVLGAPGPPESDPGGTPVRKYAHRRRPGTNDLFSVDDAGRTRRAELAISTDYAGVAPAVWDGTATWRSLSESGWKLLKDRLGIEINATNPETWTLPKNDGQAGQADAVRGVTAQAAPTSQNPRFYLLLTTTIEGDAMLPAVAGRRDASPLAFAVRRRVDAKDHFRKQVIRAGSRHNGGGVFGSAIDLVPRDDTSRALAHAEALRSAHELPLLAGGLGVPWIAHAIGIGDLISRIDGLEVDLATNAGGAAGESPNYPVVAGFSWSCQEPQRTTYILSDRRAEPERA
jgi:hypothetical protein